MMIIALILQTEEAGAFVPGAVQHHIPTPEAHICLPQSGLDLLAYQSVLLQNSV